MDGYDTRKVFSLPEGQHIEGDILEGPPLSRCPFSSGPFSFRGRPGLFLGLSAMADRPKLGRSWEQWP